LEEAGDTVVRNSSSNLLNIEKEVVVEGKGEEEVMEGKVESVEVKVKDAILVEKKEEPLIQKDVVAATEGEEEEGEGERGNVMPDIVKDLGLQDEYAQATAAVAEVGPVEENEEDMDVLMMS